MGDVPQSDSASKPRKRKGLIIFGAIALMVFLMLFFLSSILRTYLVKNSEKLIGRKIDLNELHINYLTMSVRANRFVMYEKGSSEQFASFDELRVDFAPWHLLNKEYAFTEISLVNPSISVIYSSSGFNFDDLMESDTTQVKKADGDSAKPIKFLVRNLNASGGHIRYEDRTTSSVSELNQFAIHIPEIAWDNSRSELGIDFVLGKKGAVSLGGSINQQEGTFTITANSKNIDLEPFTGYFKPYFAISSITGLLSTHLVLTGDLNNPLYFMASGDMGVTDCTVYDSDHAPVLKAKEMFMQLDTLDLAKENYYIKTIRLEEPVITAILDKGGMNLQRVMAPFFADTVSTGTSIDSTMYHYSIQELDINKGMVAFADQTLKRPFHFDLTDINFTMADFSDTATRVKMDYAMTLNHSGSFNGKAVVDMVSFNNIAFEGAVRNLDLINFSPYSEFYIAKPITKGAFNYDCTLDMTATTLKNNNKVRIVDLELGKKIKDKPVYKVPVGLALYILKDRKGIIGFDVPVTGSPADPSFKLGKLIWKATEKFLIKTATAPFDAIANLFGISPESIKQVPFEFLQDSLTGVQRESLDKIAGIIAKKPELVFTFTQCTHPEKEQQLLAVQEAKRLFSKQIASGVSHQDTLSRQAVSVSNNDKAFRLFLGMAENDGEELVPDFCMKKIGQEAISIKLNELMKKREEMMRNYCLSKNIPEQSIAFHIIDFRNMPEELKKPHFAIEITSIP